MEKGIEFNDCERLLPEPEDMDAVLVLEPEPVPSSLSFLDFCAVAGSGVNMSIRVLCRFTPFDTATDLAFSTVVVVVSLVDVTGFSVRLLATEPWLLFTESTVLS